MYISHTNLYLKKIELKDGDMEASYSVTLNGFLNQRSKLLMRMILGLTLCLLATLIVPVFAADTQAIPKGPVTDYYLPQSTPVTKVEYGLNVESLPSGQNFFYSNQFGILGGDGGYIGLQANGSRVNGTTGQTAVFSIFGAGIQANPSNNCSVESPDQNFDGYIGQQGTSCRIPFVLTPNTIYSLVVERTSNEVTGAWWTGTIINQTTKVSTTIASIKVYSTWTTLKSWTAQWTEYFGELPSTCANLPYSKVRFYAPKVNGGAAMAPGSNRYSATGNCTNVNAYVQDNTVVQEMGARTIMGSVPVNGTTPLPPVRAPETTPPSGTIYVPPTTPPSGTKYVPTTKVPNTVKVTLPLPVTVLPTVKVTLPPPVTVPPAPAAPTGIVSSNNGCFLIWCTVTLKWNRPTVPGTSYVLTAHTNAPVKLNTNSMTIPWVVSGNSYRVSVYAVNTNGAKSAMMIANIWV